MLGIAQAKLKITKSMIITLTLIYNKENNNFFCYFKVGTQKCQVWSNQN